MDRNPHPPQYERYCIRHRLKWMLVPNLGLGIKRSLHTHLTYTSPSTLTHSLQWEYWVSESRCDRNRSPSGLINILLEAKNGEISAVPTRDPCPPGDSVIGFIKGAQEKQWTKGWRVGSRMTVQWTILTEQKGLWGDDCYWTSFGCYFFLMYIKGF